MDNENIYETVKLRTGIDSNFLADTLTTDIELTDALFDLIDNSIDAARNSIISDDFSKDIRGLPSDYSGYKIKLRFGCDSIIIEDNCIGMDTNVIERSAFYTGMRSNHKYGIGYYGLGLKRALLKVGSKYGMITSNGEHVYKAVFDKNTFSSDDEHALIAKKYSSKEKHKTIFIVNELHSNIKSQISDKEWLTNAINELSIRYSIFLRKGLEITIVNSQKNHKDTLAITPSVPELRIDGVMRDINDELNESSVKCDFYVGVHREYKFPGEWGHDQKLNEKLTKSYGIYYICNDRVIVSASTENRHGFITQWHPEYGGFICLAYITGENPKDLPWNTAKTELKVNSSLFLSIRKKIEPLAKTYRSQANTIIKVWTSTKHLPDDERRKIFSEKIWGKTFSDDEISAVSRKNSKIEIQKKNVSKSLTENKKNIPEVKLKTTVGSIRTVGKNNSLHAKNWNTLLPPMQFPISDYDNILNNLIIEASNLKIDDAHHAACLLYRSLFEAAFRAFVKKNKLFDSVIEHFYSKGEGSKKNHTEEYKRNQGIDLSICSHWLIDNSLLFPKDVRKKLMLCSKNLRIHIKIMNGVVHGLQLLGNDGKVQKIRNETIELLEFLVVSDIDNL